MPPRALEPAGVALVDKPAGPSSHAIVAQIRRLTGARTGHAGTLDPFATGLLLVLSGRTTKIAPWLVGLDKRYLTDVDLTALTSTGDPEGEIVTTGVVPAGELELPVGKVRQRPPAYSAVKVDGRRAYSRARAGEQFDLPEREVFVHRFEERWRDGERRAFVIDCSSGTYVRSLISALGDAYCERLRRTAIGDFLVADADPGRPVSLSRALSFMPAVELASEDATRVAHGARVPATDADLAARSDVTVRLVDAEGLIAIAEPADGGRTWHPVVGLR